MSVYLHKIMFKSFPTAHSHILNSFQLVNISDIFINDNFTLISLDVVSLFTNIPIELAIDSICKRWGFISINCSLPLPEFISTIKFVLNSTFFTFNGVTYQQTYGTPMGSPLSPIIANIVLQDLEEKALAALTFTPPFYVTYVDDVALAVPSSLLEYTLNIFNSFQPRMQFTIEVGTGNKLNFLTNKGNWAN